MTDNIASVIRDRKRDASSDVVVAQFLDAIGHNPVRRSVLDQWIASHPEHSEALVDAAMEHDVLGGTGHDAAVAEDDAEIAAISTRVLASLDIMRHGPAKIQSLVWEAKAHGHTHASLAKRLRLDIPTLQKIESHLIVAASIPAALIKMLAESVGRTPDEVSEYLNSQPGMLRGLAANAKTKPKINTAEPFDAAVRSAPKIEPVDRQFWLDESRSDANDLG
jgi:transcriptional regulator with XRE-family HTH domain